MDDTTIAQDPPASTRASLVDRIVELLTIPQLETTLSWTAWSPTRRAYFEDHLRRAHAARRAEIESR